MTKKEFTKITSEIIKREFPGSVKPFIVFKKKRSDDFFMMVTKTTFFFPPLLFIDAEVFDMPDNAIIGCLVHELCHINNWKASERDIDQLVIDLGYGNHLHEFLKYHDSKYQNYKKNDGLTKKEVRRQLKNKRKY